MGFPIILVDSASGSDLLASGAGPTTALTGTNASTDGAGTLVTLDGSPDLTNVATDGSHAIYLADATAGARNFGKITAKNAGAFTVTVANAFGLSLSGKSWAIGGKRASIGSTTSLKLWDNNGAAGDAMPGWAVEMQSAYAETIAATLNTRRSGDTTDGPIILRGVGTLPVLTFSNNGVAFSMRGASQFFENFEMRNTNATKTASIAFQCSSSSQQKLSKIKISHATDKFWKAGSTILTCKVQDCEIGRCASIGLDLVGSATVITNCWIHHCGSHGIVLTGAATCEVTNNFITNNSGDGINNQITGSGATAPFKIAHNTIDSNTGDGIEFTTATAREQYADLLNNILSNNGGYGLNLSSGSITIPMLQANLFLLRGNNFYNNTAGKYNPSTLSALSEFEQTLDPGYDANFMIGTNLKAKGYPVGGTLPIGGYSAGYSYIDPGAAQRQEAAAADYPVIGNVRSGITYNSGALTGNMTLPAVADVESPVQYGTLGTEFTGTFTAPAVGDVEAGVQYGGSGTQFTGTFAIPAIGDVQTGVQYGAAGTEFTGTFVVPIAGNVRNAVGYGTAGVEFTGTLVLPSINDVQSAVTYGAAGTEFTGVFVVPTQAQVELTVTYGAAAEFTGTLDSPSQNNVRSGVTYKNASLTGNMTLPASADVESGVQYGTNGVEFTGTVTLPVITNVKTAISYGAGGVQFTGTVTLPAIGDVQLGVQFGAGGNQFTGNMVLPAVGDVRIAIQYGALGTEFTGTYVAGAGSCDYPLESNVRFGIVYDNGVLTGTLIVPTLPAPAEQITAILNTYNNNGVLADGVKVYHQQVVPSPNVAVYDDTVKESISSNGIVTIPNLFIGATYLFWRGRSAKIRKRIEESGVFGITPPQNFEAMVIDQDVHLTWEVAFESEIFVLAPILGNNSLDPCLT